MLHAYVIAVLRQMWDHVPSGCTSLITGCYHGYVEIVKYLVDVKASIEAKNNIGG